MRSLLVFGIASEQKRRTRCAWDADASAGAIERARSAGLVEMHDDQHREVASLGEPMQWRERPTHGLILPG